MELHDLSKLNIDNKISQIFRNWPDLNEFK